MKRGRSSSLKNLTEMTTIDLEALNLNSSPLRKNNESINQLRRSGYSPKVPHSPRSTSRRKNSWNDDLESTSDLSTNFSSPRESIHVIDLNNCEIQKHELLGKGATSNVFSGTVNGFSVAVKEYIDGEIDEVFDDIKREIILMEKINHPKIIKCLGHRVEHNYCFLLFMELCHGTLRELVKARADKLDYFSSGQIINYIRQITEGLVFLHEYKPTIIHRDLKSENIFYLKLYGQETPSLKIGDFGEALLKIKKKKRTPNAGTLEFRAPEMFSEQKEKMVRYNEKVDIWSLGMILFELLTLELPYHTEFGSDFLKISNAIQSGKKPVINQKGSRTRARVLPILYEQCTRIKPSERPSSREIIEDFLNNFELD